MASPSSPEHPHTLLPALVGGTVAVIALLFSWAGDAFFTWFTAVVTLLTARELMVLLAGAESRAPGWAVAIGAGIFPLAASRWGLPGAAVAVALVVPLVAGRLVVRGLVEGAVRLGGVAMFVALYVGLFGAYLVLVREHLQVDGSGTPLVAGLILMLSGYHLGTWVGDTRIGGKSMIQLPWVPSWTGAFIGIAGSVAGGLISIAFMGPRFGVASLSLLGVVVGLAALAGELASGLIFSESQAVGRRATVPGYGGLFVALQAALLSAPAFFFGFRLYLV
jgi:hypothetical protein